jgi:hypothetical protein
MNSMICHQTFDTKAFKGKGVAWEWLGSLRDSLAITWQDMRVVVAESNAVESNVHLLAHKIPGLAQQGGIKDVRWRYRGGLNPHTHWRHVHSLIQLQPLALRNYYTQLNQRVLDLNCLAGIQRSIATRLLIRLTDRTMTNGADLFVAWIRGDISSVADVSRFVVQQQNNKPEREADFACS